MKRYTDSRKRRMSNSVLMGIGTLLNISGRSRVYDEYMRGNIMLDYRRDAMALKQDGIIVARRKATQK